MHALTRCARLLQMLQHTWTYKPLVHDVLGLSLNRVTVEEAPPAAAAAVGLAPQAPVKKHFEVWHFWRAATASFGGITCALVLK